MQIDNVVVPLLIHHRYYSHSKVNDKKIVIIKSFAQAGRKGGGPEVNGSVLKQPAPPRSEHRISVLSKAVKGYMSLILISFNTNYFHPVYFLLL